MAIHWLGVADTHWIAAPSARNDGDGVRFAGVMSEPPTPWRDGVFVGGAPRRDGVRSAPGFCRLIPCPLILAVLTASVAPRRASYQHIQAASPCKECQQRRYAIPKYPATPSLRGV